MGSEGRCPGQTSVPAQGQTKLLPVVQVSDIALETGGGGSLHSPAAPCRTKTAGLTHMALPTQSVQAAGAGDLALRVLYAQHSVLLTALRAGVQVQGSRFGVW